MVAFTEKDQRRHAAAEKEAMVVIRDRIFIARDVKEMALEVRWASAMLGLHTNHDTERFAILFGSSSNGISLGPIRYCGGSTARPICFGLVDH